MVESNIDNGSFIKDAVERIHYHIDTVESKDIKRDENGYKSNKNVLIKVSIAETTFITDYWCAKVYFGLFDEKCELISERSLNFIVFQNIKTHDVSITITSDNDLNLIFKSITKYPKALIDKYLPSILNSTALILLNSIK